MSAEASPEVVALAAQRSIRPSPERLALRGLLGAASVAADSVPPGPLQAFFRSTSDTARRLLSEEYWRQYQELHEAEHYNEPSHVSHAAN